MRISSIKTIGPQQPALRLIEILIPKPAKTLRLMQTSFEPRPTFARPVRDPLGACKNLPAIANPCGTPASLRSAGMDPASRACHNRSGYGKPSFEPISTLTPALADPPREYLFQPAKTFARLLQISFQDNPYIFETCSSLSSAAVNLTILFP